MVEDSFATDVELRRRAEERLVALSKGDGGAAPTGDASRLVHELQVHKIELEMQNEELVRSRDELEAALGRYVSLYNELYDFAPIGYVTLRRDGAIQKANLTAARIVGEVRAELVSRPLRPFVAVADRAAFDCALSSARAGKTGDACEVALTPAPGNTGEARYVQLTLSATERDDELLAVLIDVTERRRSEEQLRAWQKLEAVGRGAGGVARNLDHPPGHAPVVTAAKTKGPLGGTETILILDDEPALRTVARRILASAGYAVLVAASGAEALAACEGHPGTIHMALSDVVMPEMNGLVFAEHLRSIRPDTKVLHMSGYTAGAVTTSGRLDEARFISKPFGSKELLEKVREVLDDGRLVVQAAR